MRKLTDILKGLLLGLSYLIVEGLAIAIILYIIVTYFGEKKEPPGFELATISALIGGFILASAFFGKASPGLQLRMRQIGVLYLVATLAFVVFVIYFPIIDKLPNEITFYGVTLFIPLQDIAEWTTSISMVVGAFSFAMGTFLLSFIIPRLWRKSYSGLI